MRQSKSRPPHLLMQEALTLHRSGDHRKAEKIARRVLDAYPRNADLLQFVAMLCNAQKKHGDAIALCQRALKLAPESAVAHYNLATTLLELDRYAEALPLLRKADALRPNDADTLTNLSIALVQLYHLEEGEATAHAALGLAPGAARAHYALGMSLMRQERFAGALESFISAGEAHHPEPAEVHFRIGETLLRQRLPTQALVSLEASLRLRPNHSPTLYALAEAYRALDRSQDAVQQYDAALRADPDNMAAFLARSLEMRRVGNWRDFDKHLAKINRSLPAGCGQVGPFAVLSLIDDGRLLRACAERFADEMAKCAPPPLPQRLPTRRGRIRVGYLSADFRVHPVARLTAGLFEKHDRERFEVYGFSFGKDDGSELRARISKGFDHFLHVASESPAQIAARVRELEIDIAVDLTGYTRDHRCQVFVARPAPIQVGYLGYPGTAGAAWLDYVVVDPVLVPTEGAAHYTEKLVYLPECYQVNDDRRGAAQPAPARSEHGLPDGAFVFCCMNDTSKITPPVFDVWMKILQGAPDSVLWLAARNPAVADNLRREAAARGVDSGRLVFATSVPSYDEHIARLACADLFLDTYPYTAHTTGSDALWAGVPLLTYAGQTYAARVAASLLHAIQLPELITETFDDYIAKAVALAHDAQACRALRDKVTEQRTRGSLFDTSRFCRHLEDAYQEMVAIWLAGDARRPISVPARPR